MHRIQRNRSKTFHQNKLRFIFACSKDFLYDTLDFQLLRFETSQI